MEMEPEKIVLEALKVMGHSAIKIIESTDETPDILVDLETEKILIEVKSKFDDEEYELEKKEKLQSGQVFRESFYTRRQNTISKSVKKAASQLETKNKLADFYLVWLIAVQNRQDIKVGQFESTLYGSVDTLDWGSDDNTLRPCFYFENSDFFNHKTILDGAVISNYKEGKLCLNNFSERYNKFKNSVFCKSFGNAILDPIEYEKQGHGYIADTTIDRKKKDAVLSYVRDKYQNPKLLEINMGHHSGTILVNNEGTL